MPSFADHVGQKRIPNGVCKRRELEAETAGLEAGLLERKQRLDLMAELDDCKVTMADYLRQRDQ
jgi:hypothetical protein